MCLSIPSISKKAMIHELLSQSTPWGEIQKKLNVSPNTISTVSKIMKLDPNRVPSSNKPGRPTKITPSIRSFIDAETLQNSLLGTKKLSHLIHSRFSVDVSFETVRSARRQLKFLFKRLRKRPLLTEAHIAARLKFCSEQLTEVVDWGRDVIISDESRFCLFSDNKMGWVKKGACTESCFVSVPKFQESIMCWGAIGHGYKSPLVFFDSTVDTDAYISMLQNNRILDDIRDKFNGRVTMFQQDGAPAHRSSRTKLFIQSKIGLIKGWPPNSPDLSVIENVWGLLKKAVNSRNPRSINEVKRILQEERENLDQTMINRLVADTPDRFRLSLMQNGRFIGHILRYVHNMCHPANN
jgi:transposase